jgi:hypothetical protein
MMLAKEICSKSYRSYESVEDVSAEPSIEIENACRGDVISISLTFRISPRTDRPSLARRYMTLAAEM